MLDKIGKKIVETGQFALKGTKKLADIAAINSKISDEERTLDEYFRQLGELYYTNFAAEPSEPLSALCLAIAQTKASIGELTEQLKKEKGVKLCLTCCAELSESAQFCAHCGAPVVVQAAPEAEEKPVCPSCGAPISEDMAFCTACGAKLK